MTDHRGTKVLVRTLCAIGVLVVSSYAAELNFTAGVDRTTVGLGEQITLTVTVEGNNIGGAPRPQLPALLDFNQLGSTSSQSTSVQFVNGRMSQQQTISFIYFLSPKKLGELLIGPCKLDFRGSTYQTQPIAITVTRESQAPAQRQPGPGPTPRGGRASDYVRLGAGADRTSVYVGEQVTVTYTFYTRARIGNLGIKETPSFSGFWSERIFDAKNLDYRDATLNGQRYSAATLKQVALFPTQSGQLKVDRMMLNGEVIVSGGFFFDSSEPFEVGSDPITITVKPLPEESRPADFAGGVGEFQLSAQLSSERSTDGEPVTLTVKVSGTGNIGLVGEPPAPSIPGVKVLSPETKGDVRTSSGRVSGSRTFAYPLIPQSDGKLAVPEMTMSFFNPKTGKYYTLRTPRLEFVATGAAGRSAPLPEQSSGVHSLGTDIRHIKTAVRFSPKAGAGWSFVLYPVGLLILAAGAVMGRHRRRLEADRGYARRSRSSRLVRARLKEATALLGKNDLRGFYAALSTAVVGYVGDRFNLEASGMTGDELRAALAQQEVDGDTVTAILGVTSQCDFARFSPGMAQCDPKELLEKARIILEKL